MENRYLIHALTERDLGDEVEIQAVDENGNTVTLTEINADIDSISHGGWPIIIRASAIAKLRISQE